MIPSNSQKPLRFRRSGRPRLTSQTGSQAPSIPTLPKSVTNPAAWTYERLVNYINEFEADLDDDHEIGARLVNFGSSITFHIQDIGYHGPDIIDFSGVDSSGQKVQLIQHMSQLSVLLIAMQKMEEEPRRIGFDLTQRLKGDSDE